MQFTDLLIRCCQSPPGLQLFQSNVVGVRRGILQLLQDVSIREAVQLRRPKLKRSGHRLTTG
jgi:hypothetical protein